MAEGADLYNKLINLPKTRKASVSELTAAADKNPFINTIKMKELLAGMGQLQGASIKNTTLEAAKEAISNAAVNEHVKKSIEKAWDMRTENQAELQTHIAFGAH